MATTVLPARLLSKLGGGLLTWVMIGCQSPAIPELPRLNNQHVIAQSRKGVLHVSDSLFSGSIFGLYPNTTDTTFIKSYWHGKEHGWWRQYYSNGKLRERRYFNHGKKEGEYLAWWPNGQRRLIYRFADGEYHGTCQEWNRQGVLIKEMNYQHGYEVGRQRLWYSDGKVKSNYVMKDGRRFGLLGTKNCTNVTDSIF